MDDTQNIAQSIIETMERLAKPAMLTNPPDQDDFTGPVVAAVPNGFTVHDLTEKHRAALTVKSPLLRSGKAVLNDLDSFIAWVNRHKGDTSVLFGEIQPEPSLLAVIDYHAQGAPNLAPHERDPLASPCKHRAEYKFPLSEEWRRWNKISDVPLEKDSFGEFIEANAKDLLDPTPALLSGNTANAEPWEQRMGQIALQLQGRFGQYSTLVQLSRSFQVHETGHINVTTNRDTGEAQVQFLTEHRDPDGAPLRLPNLFMVAIPVFQEGALYRMAVRFRYRKAGESVKFIVSLYNPDVALRDAAREALRAAQAATELPLMIGRPEA